MARVTVSQAVVEAWYSGDAILKTSQALAEEWHDQQTPRVYVSSSIAEAWVQYLPVPPQSSSPGGFDLRFTMPELADDGNGWIDLLTNVVINPTTNQFAFFRLRRINDTFELSLFEYPQNLILEAIYTDDAYDVSQEQKVRIYFHNEFVTWYIGERLLYTFAFLNIEYPDTVPSITLMSGPEGGDITLTDVMLSENHDWRPDIYLETEGTGMSALGSVIQERPIEMFCRSDGEIYFYYGLHPEPFDHRAEVRKIERVDSAGKKPASDLILYYRDVVAISDIEAIEQDGFSTMVVKLPNLDTGAKQAARIMNLKNRESRAMVTVEGRADLAVEQGDVLRVEYSTSGIQETYEVFFHVEEISLGISNAKSTMILLGRSYETS